MIFPRIGSNLMPIAFFDVDRTIVGAKTYLVILHHFWRIKWIRLKDLLKFILFGARYQLGNNVSEELAEFGGAVLAGKDAIKFEGEIEELFQKKIKKFILDSARQKIKEHQDKGHSVVLISATFEDLANLIGRELGADKVIATQAIKENGRLSGHFSRVVFGEEKLIQAAKVSQHLDKDYFYSDCSSDIPLLLAVGFPQVVNPDWRLKKIAQKKEWPIHYWYN